MASMGSGGQDASLRLPHVAEMLAAFDLVGKQKFNGKRINESLNDSPDSMRKRARMQIKPTSDSDKRFAVLHAKVVVALLDVYNESYMLAPSPGTPCPRTPARASLSSSAMFLPGTPCQFTAPNAAPVVSTTPADTSTLALALTVPPTPPGNNLHNLPAFVESVPPNNDTGDTKSLVRRFGQVSPLWSRHGGSRLRMLRCAHHSNFSKLFGHGYRGLLMVYV